MHIVGVFNWFSSVSRLQVINKKQYFWKSTNIYILQKISFFGHDLQIPNAKRPPWPKMKTCISFFWNSFGPRFDKNISLGPLVLHVCPSLDETACFGKQEITSMILLHRYCFNKTWSAD